MSKHYTNACVSLVQRGHDHILIEQYALCHLVVNSLTPPTGIEHKTLVYEQKQYKRIGLVLVQSRQHHHLIEMEIVLVMI